MSVKEILCVKLDVKPFSANKMHYRSKKVDTREYKAFKGTINDLLGSEDFTVGPKARLKLTLVVGFSNKASDLDNAFKPLLDAMQLAMGFNDNQIYEIDALKDVVPKGEEYLLIKLEEKKNSSFIGRVERTFKKLKGAF